MTEVSNKTLAEIVYSKQSRCSCSSKIQTRLLLQRQRTLETACVENNIPLPKVLLELEKLQDEYSTKILSHLQK
jgi:hypothetical protein